MKESIKFKKGDTVIPRDGSWVVGVSNGKLGNRPGIAINNRKFTVIATDLVVPAIELGELTMDLTFYGEPVVNDLLLKAKDNAEYIFIRSSQVKLVKPEPKPVPFLEAVKAYSKGKAIRCKRNGGYKEYSPCGLKNSAISLLTEDVFEATWYIVEGEEG
jgi:hypothetical protein